MKWTSMDKESILDAIYYPKKMDKSKITSKSHILKQTQDPVLLSYVL